MQRRVSEALRTVEIRGPAGRGEAARVLRACALAAIAGLLIIARVGPGGAASSALAPYQVRFGDLSQSEQRIARELREGIADAELTRGRTGTWPTPEALAADGVPPFAADPLAPKLRWSMKRDQTVINFLGQSGPEDPAYLVVIQEPEPGAGDPPDTPPDDVHHKLSDGTILHVYSCIRDAPPGSDALTAKPWLEGWKQLVVDEGKSK